MNYLRRLQLARVAEDGGAGGNPVTTSSAAEAFVFSDVRELRGATGEIKAENESLKARLAAIEASTKSAADEAKAALESGLAAAQAKIEAAEKSTRDRLVRAEIKAGAVAAGLAHLDFLKLIDTSAVSVSDDGDVQVPGDFWSKLKTQLPHLFAATGAERGTTTNPGGAPKPAAAAKKAALDMSPADYKAALARIAKGIVD